MRITNVVWLPSVIDKLEWKHQVTTREVEQVFANAPRFKFAERGQHQGENVYVAFGQTDGGRYLAVWFIYKLTQEALVLSAREIDAKERKSYGKK
ncbi:MAG: BrnT family toxin [Chloroflexi bacterium]|nr:BrnT family toxin [Chloroflexota bacterium]